MVESSGKKAAAKNFETYKKVKTLGVGSFGTAYLVECLSNNTLAVIKQIDIAQMSEEERRETLNEAKILEVLNHPNIVRFREVYKTKKGKLCIVMDYADDGDLQGKIKERFKTVDR
jgi:NIMA (never in mitosis gene a)-related kinase